MPLDSNGSQVGTMPEPPNFRIRFVWLVAAHVVIGVLASLLSDSLEPDTGRSAFLAGIMLGQLSLLGIWGGLGETVFWKRLIDVMLGLSYLTCLYGLVEGWIEVSFPILLLCAIASMIFVMLIVRFMTGAIHHDRSPSSATRNHQFSIRHLFVLMSVTACVAALLKIALPLVGARSREEYIWTILWCIVYAVIAIIPLWCVLASKRPVVYALCVVAGEAYLAFVLVHMADPNYDEDVMAMIFAATQAMCVVVTLLVIRSWGYRLMPMRSRCSVVEESPK